MTRHALLLAALCLLPSSLLAAGIPIRGRVLDAGGAGLGKVPVRLVPLPASHAAGLLELAGKGEPEAVARGESGADGSFRLEAPGPGMWKVVVGGPGLVPQANPLTPLLTETDLPAVRLDKDAGLTVRVAGPDGKPLPGVRVRTVPERLAAGRFDGWGASGFAVTDAEGKAALPRVASGALTVRAWAAGRVPVERKGVRVASLELRLAAGRELPIRVLDAAGKPAADVLVSTEGGGGVLGGTDAGGVLSLPVAEKAPTLRLALLAADGRRLAATAVPFRPGEPREPRELRLPAAAEVEVRAVSAVDGRPLPQALLWTTEDPGAFRPADGYGTARLPVPSAGLFAIQAGAVGFVATPLEVKRPGKTPLRSVTLSLEPDLAVTGVVVDEAGAPVAGAEITPSVSTPPGSRPMMFSRMRAYAISGTLARSGPDGRFRLGRLVEDVRYELTVRRAGFAPARMDVDAPVPGRPAPPLRIVLSRGRSAFGRVLGPDERPVAGAQVTLRTAQPSDPRARVRAAFEPEILDTFEAATGTDGRFDLKNLPAGRYDLTAKGRGFAPLTVPSLEIPEAAAATDLGTVVLAPGVALEGHVVDEAGKPVEGAEVRASESSGEPLPLPLPRREPREPAAVTGLDGFFRVEDLRAGSTVDAVATRSGYAPGEAPGVHLPAERPVRIILQAVGALSGRVVDPDGEPVPRAAVRVEVRPRARRGGGGGVFFSGAPLFDTTDAEGAFRIADVPPGLISLVAQAAGWQNATVDGLELKTGEEKSGIEILLSPAAILEGRVLSPAGRPLPGAEVRLSFEDTRGGGGFSMATTDGDGHYVLDNLAPGHRSLEAAHPEYGTTRVQAEVRVGDNSLDITLEGGHEVAGRVVDDTGAPVAGADVQLRRSGGFQSSGAVSGADGSFRIAAVADGSYGAGATKEGFAAAERVEVTVSGAAVGGIELRLSQGGAIVGRISGVEMAELARVRIYLRQSRFSGGSRIEPDGSYRIENVRVGEWQVQAELPGTGLHAEGTVRLEPGAAEARLDLEMEQGLELSGRLRRNGTPVPGEPLMLQGPQMSMAETDADGRFRFQGLTAGTYRLRLMDRSGGPGHEEKIELQSDQEISIDLQTADVDGRVIDAADSSPLSGVSVSLVALESGETEARAQTDSRGVFVLRGVTEGSWRLRAQADGYAPAEADVRVDRATPPDTVELSLKATEGVAVQLVSAAGPPPTSLTYAVLDPSGRSIASGSAAVSDDGRARLARVPPGGWQVLLLADGAAITEITVTAPGDAGRVLLAAPCRLRIKVRPLEGAGLDATVRVTGEGGRPFRGLGRSGEPTISWDLNRGSFNFNRLPPGTWEVAVTAADGRAWQTTVTTAPGVEAEAVME